MLPCAANVTRIFTRVMLRYRMKTIIPEWAIRTKADQKAIDQGCYWDQDAADKIINFAETVFQSQFLKKKIRLLEWQTRFLQSIYAWRNQDGSRRFRSANLHIAKKNGG